LPRGGKGKRQFCTRQATMLERQTLEIVPAQSGWDIRESDGRLKNKKRGGQKERKVKSKQKSEKKFGLEGSMLKTE